MDEGPPVAEPVKKKRAYNAEFKIKVFEYAEKESNRGAGWKFNILESSVHDWRRQKEKLLTLPKKQKQLSRGGQ